MLLGSLTTAAGDQSEPGAYAITQGSLLASANYSMTFLAGLLTVESASPGPGTSASFGAAAYGTGPFAQFRQFLPPSTGGAGGTGILVDDPRFGGTVVCLDGGGCTTLPADTTL